MNNKEISKQAAQQLERSKKIKQALERARKIQSHRKAKLS